MDKDPRIFLGHIIESIYFGVDMELTWETAVIDVLKLKRRVVKIKELLEKK